MVVSSTGGYDAPRAGVDVFHAAGFLLPVLHFAFLDDAEGVDPEKFAPESSRDFDGVCECLWEDVEGDAVEVALVVVGCGGEVVCLFGAPAVRKGNPFPCVGTAGFPQSDGTVAVSPDIQKPRG